MHIRRYESTDGPEVVAIMNRCGHRTTVADFHRDLDEPGERGWENAFVAVVDGQIVGDIRGCFVETPNPNRFQVFCFGEVDAEYRRRGVGQSLYTHLIQHLAATAAGEGIGIRLIRIVPAASTDEIRILVKCGFHTLSRVTGMSRSVGSIVTEAQWPLGYLSRPSILADADPIADIYNQAFRWRREPTVLTSDSVRYEMAASDYQTELNPVVIAPNGDVVAFANCEVREDVNGMDHDSEGDEHDSENGSSRNGGNQKFGYINTIAVRPAYQGKGLGRVLLQHCIHTFQEMGLSVVGLSVESDNSTALSLYEAAGFSAVKEHLHYELVIGGHSS